MCTSSGSIEIKSTEITAIYWSLLQRRRKYEVGSLEYEVLDGVMKKFETLNAFANYTLEPKP